MKKGLFIDAGSAISKNIDFIFNELPYGSGTTILHQVIKRAKMCEEIDDIVVITTSEYLKKVEEIAKSERVKVVSEENNTLLNTYFNTAKTNVLATIARISGDSPCIDPEVIDDLVRYHEESKNDYTSNFLTNTFPKGFEIELFSFKVLEEIYQNSEKEEQSTNFTKYIYKKNPDKYIIGGIESQENYSNLKLKAETMESYKVLSELFDKIYSVNSSFGLEDVINFFNKKRVRNDY